jgi:GDP-4-dehydro-6-deoxy-D-mannose reductase
VAEQKLDTRVVVAGSAAEYGAVAAESNPVGEDHPARPHSVYGVTKLLQTESSLFYWRRFGVDVVIARIFNLLGPGASERLFVGSVEQQIRRVRDHSLDCLTVGNLDASRDYLAPARAAEALITLMRCGGAGEVYNVGSGVPVPMRDLLRALLAEGGVETCPVREQVATAEKGHDVPVIYADVRKLRRLEADGPAQDGTP